jgi:hypothetical protein
MPDSVHPKRLTRSPRPRLLAIATLVGGVLLAGCGGSAPSPTTATPGGTSNTASTAASADSIGPSPGPPGALAYSRCMRSSGVPNFPDPQAGGGFDFHASAGVISSPAFKAAQAKCGRLLPRPTGLGGGSFPPQVKAQALVQLRGVAQCMRQHGISDFPDPRTTAPANLSLGGYSEITDYEGVFLLFPATIDMQSPAWEHAAAACGSLAESFNHPHH